jgi:hypothetical protein
MEESLTKEQEERHGFLWKEGSLIKERKKGKSLGQGKANCIGN